MPTPVLPPLATGDSFAHGSTHSSYHEALSSMHELPPAGAPVPVQQHDDRSSEERRSSNISADTRTESSVPTTVTAELPATQPVVLSHEVVAKLEKATNKEAKTVSKILKSELKTSALELSKATKELANLEKEHKKAVKDEASAATSHRKAERYAHKLDVAAAHAKTKFEQAEAAVRGCEAQVQSKKMRVGALNERVREKTAEIEEMRKEKNVADRDREAQLEVLRTH